MIRELIWRAVATVVSRPAVATWLIERSKRTPYSPITSRDGADIYMDRWWVFNPYSKDEKGNAGPARFDWLPSVRVHHILRADDDAHLHDHPWNARTVVLRGWYAEERPLPTSATWRAHFDRPAGYTGRVLFNSYHRISEVAPGGVYTLWFTWRYQGTWGFLVDGKKVPWREYLAQRPRA